MKKNINNLTNNSISAFLDMVRSSSNIVFFGGAGVSTESGIPDFRSVDGLYNQKYDYPPEMMLSSDFFYRKTNEFFKFYKDKMLVTAKPNTTHLALAKLEQDGKLKAVITQNIDGLHQAAGSRTVYELHGSVHRNYCTKCKTFYPIEFIAQSEAIPYCTKCNALVKPDVVLYGEGLDDNTVTNALQALSQADMLIIGGTSLTVYPAAGMVNMYKGNKLVLINKDSTSFDSKADLIINDSLGKAFERLL